MHSSFMPCFSFLLTESATQVEVSRESFPDELDALQRTKREAADHLSGLQEEREMEVGDVEQRLGSVSARLAREREELEEVLAEKEKCLSDIGEVRRQRREESLRMSELCERGAAEVEEAAKRLARLRSQISTDREELCELVGEKERAILELERVRRQKKEEELELADIEGREQEAQDLSRRLARLCAQVSCGVRE